LFSFSSLSNSFLNSSSFTAYPHFP
jgi:hypothetical protein